MSDRFDLEQGILTCWHITDDIQLLIDQNAPPEAYKALITMYNYKFENLWQIFEHMVHTRQFTSGILDENIKVDNK